jgi:hypothetical protein
VITFDDLTTRNNFFDLGINNTYQGYVWSTTLIGGETDQTGWASATVADPAWSPAPTPVSGNSYAWNWNGPQSLFIHFGAATNVTSAYLATLSSTYCCNASSVQLFGYDSTNALVATGSVLPLTNSFQVYTANFSGIYKLEFRANTNDVWFSIDSITLNANSSVPEPGSGLLLALGGLAIAGLSRLRARA